MRKIIGYTTLIGMVLSSLCYAEDYKTYKFDELKFTIECPIKCEVKRMTGIFKDVIGIILSTGSLEESFRANITIASKPNSQLPIDLERFVRMNLDRLMKKPNPELYQSKKIKLGAKNAHKIVYTNLGQNNILLRTLMIFIVEPTRVYVINYTADDDVYGKYIDMADKIIKSFKPL